MPGKIRLFALVMVLVLLPLLSGCGDSGNPRILGPGLVGIDDRPASSTPPLLTIAYTLPGNPDLFVAAILSDQPTDGDIAFDPFLGSFTITQGPDTLFFGVDSSSPDRPEYRAFLDFPLDGSTGQPTIPLDAIIQAADLTLFIEFVEFATTVPVLLDLVEYPLSGLVPADYNSPFLVSRSLSIFSSDVGNDVVIDVTPLMVEAQLQGLSDFQVRLLLGP